MDSNLGPPDSYPGLIDGTSLNIPLETNAIEGVLVCVTAIICLAN